MRSSLALAVCLALACVGHCLGEEYLLTIEEVEGLEPENDNGLPPASMSAALPPTVNGWLELNKEMLGRMNAVKTTELLVSTKLRFHLRIEENGSVMEMDGRVQKAETPAAKSVPAATGPQKPAKAASGPPRPDVVLEVELKHASEPGAKQTMKSAMPMQCGKRYRFPESSRPVHFDALERASG